MILSYGGFSGQITLPAPTILMRYASIMKYTCNTSRTTYKSNELVQYVYPQRGHDLSSFLQSIPNVFFQLSGSIDADVHAFPSLLQRLIVSLTEGDVPDMPLGAYCGSVVTPTAVWFFKTPSSNDTVFYVRELEHLRWSTDPSDLVGPLHLDHDALVQCCASEDVFAYHGVERVAAGTIVYIDQYSLRTILFGAVTSDPVHLLSRVTLQDLALSCREALREATLPLVASSQTIGVLLSGGIDSSAIAAALVHHGADVVAYHFLSPSPASDESAYAQAVCRRLAIPFIPIEASIGSDYLSEQWQFPHPYGHAGYRWMELAAERAQRDGIALLVTGRGGDLSFGPHAMYGLYDICAAPIAWREKYAMIMGTLSTDWLLPDIVKSLHRSFSLITEQSFSPQNSPSLSQRILPFFTQQPKPRPADDNLFDVMRFSAQDLVLETCVWRPHGLMMYHPYHHAAVQRLAFSIPTPYRLIPYRGTKVTKPVLRLAYADDLPPQVVRQRGGVWTSVPHQEYCLNQTSYLERLLGTPEAQVVQRGIIDPVQLTQVLQNRQQVRMFTSILIATAMTELFLRQWIT